MSASPRRAQLACALLFVASAPFAQKVPDLRLDAETPPTVSACYETTRPTSTTTSRSAASHTAPVLLAAVGSCPVLTAVGPPATGSAFTLEIEDGLGGANAAVLYGLDGPAAIPVLGGFLLIAPPLFGEIAQLGGAPGIAGAGFLNYSVPVPNDVSLVGAHVNMQAAVFDPAATGGLSLTAGIEVWVL